MGTMSEIFTSLNEYNARFQDKIDLANTSMLNLRLPKEVRVLIRDFLHKNESNLTN
jgi:hypothetical protein